MRQTPVELKISELATPIVEELGMELVYVTVKGEEKGTVVLITAEDPKTGRLGVDDCAKISRAVAVLMDVEDIISGRYTLEVSSPGIDRLLVREKDFAAYTGQEAKLETLMPTETGQKRFRGIIRGIENGVITLETDVGEQKLDYTSLSKAKLVLTDSLIKATATK